MQASEIRERFLRYFERNGHVVRASSSLVPANDPTLLFTNAGMVQFKKLFLGIEEPNGGRRAVTVQKCVRAGGKHNDLEQVGHTARHHTFFEMLGNFSFGDYFKTDAIRFAWDFVTRELGIEPRHLRVTVFEDDDEARAIWREVAALPDSRIYSLGAADNFWQMADTGPCGPCTEIYVDLARVAKDWRVSEGGGSAGAWTDVSREEFSAEEFVEGAEAGRFLEIWNLVFMQFDRQPDGSMVPLPRPSVDTGAGLERIAAVLQGVTNNYDTDIFAPIIARVERELGQRYHSLGSADLPIGEPGDDPAAFRVIADHARAVAFLLADGVFPANEGRGYVLRRILRRAVRHAWLRGRRTPLLYLAVETVIETMADAYPELRARASHIVQTTRAEEERFLATIEGGMRRFDEIAPAHGTHGSPTLRGTISGQEAFKLYDTFGFPVDLTELMARERGYMVDSEAFERCLEAQRTQSRDERKSRKLDVTADDLADASAWTYADDAGSARFTGYDAYNAESSVVGLRQMDGGRVALLLSESPFYAESGGQISDVGEVVGDGWRVEVEDVRRIAGKPVAIGRAEGVVSLGRAVARVPAERRLDTERNHTATHLLHAALRATLGDSVHQAGSLVAPDRLRFDFTHNGPLTRDQIAAVEDMVNRGVLSARPVHTAEKRYADAVAAGAMALFGEKYGDVVRVVEIAGLSTELCGGTHVRNTAEIGLFRVVSEAGIAAGVRRIEAITGTRAYEAARGDAATLRSVAESLKATPETLPRRVQTLVDERRALDKRVTELMRGSNGAGPVRALLDSAVAIGTVRLAADRLSVPDAKSLQAAGEALREQGKSVVGVLGASFADGKHSVVVVVGDDARAAGLSADSIVKTLAASAGGRGGGKPQLAQAGFPDSAAVDAVLAHAPDVIAAQISAA